MEQRYFDQLIKTLKKTKKSKDIPVSSLVLDAQKKIVGVGWNTQNAKMQISQHAEINAINKVTKKIKSLNLEKHTLITTLEPCHMCYGAIKQAKIKRVEYVLDSAKYGIHNNYSINDIDVVLIKNSTYQQEKEYRKILEVFFKKLR